MLNNPSISCEAQSPSHGHGNDHDYGYELMTRMGGEITSAAFQQASSRTNPHTLAAAPFYQPNQPSLVSLQGSALGFPSLCSWPTQSCLPTLMDHPHGWEAAASPASMARITSIIDDVMAILDADDTVIARIANARDM
jgi:hypothetical protein